MILFIPEQCTCTNACVLSTCVYDRVRTPHVCDVGIMNIHIALNLGANICYRHIQGFVSLYKAYLVLVMNNHYLLITVFIIKISEFEIIVIYIFI